MFTPAWLCRRESSGTHPRIPPIFENLSGFENWCRPCHFIRFGCGQPFAPTIPLTPPRDCTNQPAHPAPAPSSLQTSRCAVCGFGGATRMSDRNVGFHNLALVLAADQVWSVDPPDEIRLQGLLSVAQNLVSTPWLAYLLRETCYDISELVIVGWSFGNHFACHASRQLEAAGIRLRGICTLDDRASKPAHDEFDWEFVAQTRPRVRLLAVAMEFISPMKFVRKEFGLDPVRFFGANYVSWWMQGFLGACDSDLDFCGTPNTVFFRIKFEVSWLKGSRAPAQACRHSPTHRR
ncbi:unnamed protein product [Symbiodinium sp. CCMP2456]|nr:unnamed protein product [Symbiodinium sp. CCMP2456]